MNTFEKFIYLFQREMETPSVFGWYHILSLSLMIGISALIIIFRKRISQKGVKYTILILGILLILFEIMKQLVFSFNWNETTQTVSWDYRWYAFPFQFCSTPMYIMLIAGLCKKSLFRNSLYSYLATFALFAGLCVMIYPGDVFTSMIFINIQTIFWHASMFIIGILLWSTNSVEFKQKTILKATVVFVCVLAIAMLMNFIWKWAGGLSTNETFNMFYISPFYPCTLPLLDDIYANVNYFIFLMIYILGFVLAGYIVMNSAILINYIHNKTFSKKEITKKSNK